MGRANNPSRLHRRQSRRTPRIPRGPPAPLLPRPLAARSSPPFRNVASSRVVRRRAASRIARPHLRTNGPDRRSPATFRRNQRHHRRLGHEHLESRSLRQRQRRNRGHLPLHRPLSHSRIKSQRNGSLQDQRHRCPLRHSKPRKLDARQKKSTRPSDSQGPSLHANPLRRFLLLPFHVNGNRHPRSSRPPLSNHVSPGPIRLQPGSSPNRHGRPTRNRCFLPNARRRETRRQPSTQTPRSTTSPTLKISMNSEPCVPNGVSGHHFSRAASPAKCPGFSR